MIKFISASIHTFPSAVPRVSLAIADPDSTGKGGSVATRMGVPFACMDHYRQFSVTVANSVRNATPAPNANPVPNSSPAACHIRAPEDPAAKCKVKLKQPIVRPGTFSPELEN